MYIVLSVSYLYTCILYIVIFFIEKLRQLTHVVGTLSHKGIARRALPASGGKDVDGGNRKVNKGE